jgi:hypothetical protein
MNPTATVVRWYRQSTSAIRPAHRYTTEEVLQLLRPRDAADDDAPTNLLHDAQTLRLEAVRQAAARSTTWADSLTPQQRLEIGELADRLPTVVSHYVSGGTSHELLQRHGGWSTWRYDRALDLAGQSIARHLNSGRAA